MPVSKLNRNVIEAAILGFQHQKTQIDVQIAELKSMLNGGTAETAATPEAAPGKRKIFSAAARRKMAAAQKARWAKIKGEAEKPAPAPAPKAKRKLSAAAKAKLVANLVKARRAKARKMKSAATEKAAPARKKGASKKAAAKKTATAQAAATTA